MNFSFHNFQLIEKNEEHFEENSVKLLKIIQNGNGSQFELVKKSKHELN